jgi:hypothetical protein
MNKYFIIIIIAIIACIYILIGGKYTKNKDNEHFTQFNSDNINGEIEYVDFAYHGIQVKIKGYKLPYVFYPRHDLHENKRFDDIAAPGDVIIKPAYSDTLKLIKKDKVLLFTFRKFVNGLSD